MISVLALFRLLDTFAHAHASHNHWVMGGLEFGSKTVFRACLVSLGRGEGASHRSSPCLLVMVLHMSIFFPSTCLSDEQLVRVRVIIRGPFFSFNPMSDRVIQF